MTPQTRFLDRTTPPHLATLVFISCVSAVNMSIILPSLSRIADDLGTDYATIQIAVSGYLLGVALIQLVIGPLSDTYGRRPVVLGAFGIFIAASLGAVLATETWVFLSMRLLQAVVATGLVLGRAIIRDTVDTAKSASMIGYVTMGMSIAPMVGPMMGGFLEETFGWRSIFVAVALLGSAAFALSWTDQGETVRKTGATFASQMADLPELLRAQRFWGYALTAAFCSGAFFALLGGASFVAEQVFHLSPSQAGVYLGAPAIGYMVGNYLSGRYSESIGINRMVLAGTLVGAIAMGLSLLHTAIFGPSANVFFGLCILLGLGNGLTLPNTMAGQLAVRPHLAGTASGIGGTVMIGGGAALSAIAGALLTPEWETLPLQIIMFVSSVLAIFTILWVIRRAKTVGAD